MKRKKGLSYNTLIILSGIFCSSLAHAAKLVPVSEQYPNVRASGMGGVSTSIANDDGAIFTNPAGIGSQDDSKSVLRSACFPNLILGTNTYSQRIFDIYTHSKSVTVTDDVEEMIASQAIKTLFARTTFFPTLTITRLQFGVMADAMAGGNRIATNDAFPNADAVIESWASTRVGPVVGFSVPHQKSGLSFGITGKYFYRASAYQQNPVYGNSIKRAYPKLIYNVNHTRGLSIDAGMTFEFAKKWLPTLGASLINIGNASYKPLKGTDFKEIEKANVSLGASWRYHPKAQGIGAIFALEGQHLNDSRMEGGDKYHMGAEVFYGLRPNLAPIAVRAGYNLKGISYGMTIDAIFLKIDFANEIVPVYGISGTKTDRRTYARISVDLRD